MKQKIISFRVTRGEFKGIEFILCSNGKYSSVSDAGLFDLNEMLHGSAFSIDSSMCEIYTVEDLNSKWHTKGDRCRYIGIDTFIDNFIIKDDQVLCNLKDDKYINVELEKLDK